MPSKCTSHNGRGAWRWYSVDSCAQASVPPGAARRRNPGGGRGAAVSSVRRRHPCRWASRRQDGSAGCRPGVANPPATPGRWPPIWPRCASPGPRRCWRAVVPVPSPSGGLDGLAVAVPMSLSAVAPMAAPGAVLMAVPEPAPAPGGPWRWCRVPMPSRWWTTGPAVAEAVVTRISEYVSGWDAEEHQKTTAPRGSIVRLHAQMFNALWSPMTSRYKIESTPCSALAVRPVEHAGQGLAAHKLSAPPTGLGCHASRCRAVGSLRDACPCGRTQPSVVVVAAAAVAEPLGADATGTCGWARRDLAHQDPERFIRPGCAAR